MTIQKSTPVKPSVVSQTSQWQRARESPKAIAGVVALTLFTDMITYGVVIPCLPKLVMDRLGGDSSMVGFLCGCYACGLLVSTPIFAVLSDRYANRRYPTMVGSLGLVASTIGFAFANTYAKLVIARLAQGVAGGATWAIGFGMLADVFPNDRLGMVMGSVMTANTLGFTIGPVAGGFMYQFGGFQAPFFFCACLAVLNLLAVVWIEEPLVVARRLKEEEQPQGETTPLLPPEEQCGSSSNDGSIHSSLSPEGPEPKQQASVTILSLLKHRRILCCVAITVISSSVFSGIEPSLPIHLQNVYHSSPSTIGIIFGAMVLPSFTSPLIGHLSDKVGRKVITSTGLLMMAMISPLVTLTYPSVYMIIPSLMVFGFSGPVTVTPVLPEMGIIVNDLGGNAYAQVYALYNMAYGTGMFLGPVFAGFIMSRYGFTTLMVLFSLVLIIGSTLVTNLKGLAKKCFGCCIGDCS
ncbi:major facilitator superfamily domain-containing protein [Chlamydoabsidia padenii]|nr:major facilitator superfamily domain-containing protein [Chlamydoabsidia padenii]